MFIIWYVYTIRFIVLGEGIGKNADGILKPIKANLKFDNAGLCYEKGKEFTDHWWEKAFNNAAGNLNVDNTAGSVSLSVKKVLCSASYVKKAIVLVNFLILIYIVPYI